MKPIDFKGSNKTYVAPTDWDKKEHGECGDLHTWEGQADNGLKVIISAWKPTDEDKARILRGEPIFLQVCGTGQPPVSLFTGNPLTNDSTTLLRDIVPRLPELSSRMYNLIADYIYLTKNVMMPKVTVEDIFNIDELRFSQFRGVGSKTFQHFRNLKRLLNIEIAKND